MCAEIAQVILCQLSESYEPGSEDTEENPKQNPKQNNKQQTKHNANRPLWWLFVLAIAHGEQAKLTTLCRQKRQALLRCRVNLFLCRSEQAFVEKLL